MTDEELIEFCTEFRRGLLGRKSSNKQCAVVCWPLVSLLCINGVQCKSVTSDVNLESVQTNHVWIRLADGRALDPTCDQFSKAMGQKLPRVYLGEPIKELHS